MTTSKTTDAPVEKQRPFDRLIFLQNGFFTEQGHWIHEIRAWRKAVLETGMAWHAFAHVNLPPQIAAREGVDPCIPFLPGQSRRPFTPKDRLKAFLSGAVILPEILKKHYPGEPSSRDLLYVGYATEVEMIGMERWLDGLPADRRPAVAFVFHHPSHEWRTDPERIMVDGDTHRWVCARELLSECSGRIRYVASLPALAREFSRILGTEVRTLPHTCQMVQEDIPAHPVKLHDFGILGGGRPDQGIALWPSVVSRILTENPGVNILTQSPSGERGDALREVARKKDLSGRVALFASNNSGEDFLRHMMACRVILTPYDPAYYGLRSSMVFCDAACLGIPVVAHSRTSTGRMILAGVASGITYDRQDPEAIAKAAMSALERLPELNEKAQALKETWRARLSASTLLGELCAVFAE
jgi:glycosyltransferase involved in cell wall biosynthesis